MLKRKKYNKFNFLSFKLNLKFLNLKYSNYFRTFLEFLKFQNH